MFYGTWEHLLDKKRRILVPKPFSEELRKELGAHVAKEIGKLARPSELWFVEDLPKTRSGKIMRRVIKAKVLGQDTGNISTLSNPEAVEELLQAK